jgi:TRAP-type C4-dicarboxylate transport system permease small subunit
VQPASSANAPGLAHRLCGIHDWITKAGFAVATALVALIAAEFCYEVVVRYFFDAPTAWTYDVGCFFLAAVIFLSLPEMTRRRAHIHVNLIFDTLPARGARILRYAIGLLALAACLIAAWITGSETWRQYSEGVWTLTALPIPKWWVSILLPYGLFNSALHFLRQLGGETGETLTVGGSQS